MKKSEKVDFMLFRRLSVVFFIVYTTSVFSDEKARARYANFQPFKFSVMEADLGTTSVASGRSISRKVTVVNMSYRQPLSRSLGAGIGFQWAENRYESSESMILGEDLGSSFRVLNESGQINFGYRSPSKWMTGIAYLQGYSYVKDQVDKSYGKNSGWTLTVMKRLESKSVFGIGIAYFEQLHETIIFPFPIVKWQISPNWLLTNPANVGFSGRSGIEIVYSVSDTWKFGFGGAYRMQRFAVSEEDIVEFNQFVSFVRVGVAFNRYLKSDFYVGYLSGGDIELNDSKLTDFNDHMGVALSISLKI